MELGQETKRNKKHDKVKYSNNYFVKDHTGFYVLKHKMKLKPKAKLEKLKAVYGWSFSRNITTVSKNQSLTIKRALASRFEGMLLPRSMYINICVGVFLLAPAN